MNIRSLAIASLFLALLASPGAARAHGGAPEVRNFMVSPENEAQWLINTNVGPVVSRDGGQSFGWICHEAMSSDPLVSSIEYVWLPDGSMLAALGVLTRSSDGCEWTVLPGFEGLHMATVTGHPTERSLVYAASFGSNIRNRVFRSTDGGETFEDVFSAWDVFFNAIGIAPSRSERVYVSGFDILSKAWLYRSDDGGDSFTEIPVTLPGTGGYRFLGVSPKDPEVIFTTFQGRPENVVYRSKDGGDSFEELLRLETAESARHVVFDASGETLWMATTTRVFRSRDGGTTLTQLPGVTAAACAASGADRLYGCGDLLYDGFSVAQSMDEGESWESVFNLTQIKGVLECPDDSPVAQICGPLYSTFRAEIEVAFGSTPPDSEEAPGCATGCSISAPGPTTTPRPLLLFLLLLGLGILRR